MFTQLSFNGEETSESILKSNEKAVNGLSVAVFLEIVVNLIGI